MDAWLDPIEAAIILQAHRANPHTLKEQGPANHRQKRITTTPSQSSRLGEEEANLVVPKARNRYADGMRKRTSRVRSPLSEDEREGIILAVSSAFRKLKNLYTKIVPIFEDFGFTPPSAGVIARDLSEKIEKAIIQHCESFSKGIGHCDLCRFDQDWEVKICKDSGLTINQSKVINGENYIVVNYKSNSLVKSVWVL
jgi:hypothetical protein